VYAAFLLGLAAALGVPGQCAVEGEPIHWVADYCMLSMQTDDEIAVSDCIAKELKTAFPGKCASNLHYKNSMRDIMVRNGTRAGAVEQCVEDPAFMGRTVEADGVGN
jgi:hypothetical protein